jgi:hypothetical protein
LPPSISAWGYAMFRLTRAILHYRRDDNYPERDRQSDEDGYDHKSRVLGAKLGVSPYGTVVLFPKITTPEVSGLRGLRWMESGRYASAAALVAIHLGRCGDFGKISR